jgi:large subunit ribosomal protein L6
LPIEIPSGVEVKIDGTYVKVKGPKGELSHVFPPVVDIVFEDGSISVNRLSEEKFHRAMHGTARAVINNMVIGVSNGFEKELEIQGVGYRSELIDNNLVLHVGYSHTVTIEPLEGISFEIMDSRGREFKVIGYDKQVVGQMAAVIRKVRPPEPYKGKGIRYKGEYVRRKPGKAGKAL